MLTFYFGILNLIITAVLFVFAPWIITILFGPEYLDAITSFRILTVSYFFSGTFRVIAGNILVTQKELKFNMFVAIFSGLVNIVVDFYFIKLWGANGASIATLLVVILTSILNVAYLIYRLKAKGDR